MITIFPWKIFANFLLEDIGGDGIFHTNFHLSKKVNSKLTEVPRVYREVIGVWKEFATAENSMILSLSLWNNVHIKKI